MGTAGLARTLVYVDIDAHFAASEELRHPELRGLPLIIGGARNPDGRPDLRRGVVSTASYAARAFGVHSAMPLGQALRLCPQATVLPVDMTYYAGLSERVFTICRELAPLVEEMSIDEACLDVTGCVEDGLSIGRRLQARVLGEVGLSCSVGVASTRLVAKVASDLRKPHGLVVVAPGREAGFLAPLPVRRLPGLGPASERALATLGILTLGQLQTLPLAVLQARLGQAHGQALYEHCRGIDRAVVAPRGPAKSVSHEVTFPQDVADLGAARRQALALASRVGRRLRSHQQVARVVGIKLRDPGFLTRSRQLTLGRPAQDDQSLRQAAVQLLEEAWDGTPLRLLGVEASHLQPALQLDLLSPEVSRPDPLDVALDELAERFGELAPRRGTAQVRSGRGGRQVS
jgi:DNA polymerase-4